MCSTPARHAFPAYEGLVDGSWHTGPRGWAYFTFQGIELESRTVGLVGLGAIGFELVKRLQAFGMTCIAYDPYVNPQRAADAGVELTTLEGVFSRADFVSMHAAVTEETKGMIGREQFALMKPEAYFINTARAVLVDEEAMIEALREKRPRRKYYEVTPDGRVELAASRKQLLTLVKLSGIGGEQPVQPKQN